MLRGFKLRPNWYLLVTVGSWGLNFVAIKEANNQIAPAALALIRFLAMWISLVAVCLVRRESLRYPKEDALKILYLGFVSMGVYMFLFLEGMRGSTATEGAILLQMSPIFTALLAAAFGLERFSAASLIGAVVAFAGTGLILYAPSATSHESRLFSNLLVLVSALVWAYSVILMRPLVTKYSPLRVLTLSMVGGLPVMIAYGAVAAAHQNWVTVTPYGWTMFFHIAIISGVVAFLCFYEGVRQVGPTRATLYQFLVPAAAVLFSILIQGVHPTLVQVLGFAVVLGGVGFASAARAKAQAGEAR